MAKKLPTFSITQEQAEVGLKNNIEETIKKGKQPKEKTITLKTLKPIKDSSVNRQRKLNEKFDVTKERYDQMESALGKDFKTYFEIDSIK